MLRVALRGMLSRKLRLALTALSVALGVGFIAGSYILTDTMSYAFTSLFSKTGAKVDVYVQAPSHYSNNQVSWTGGDRAPVPEVLINDIRHAPGVAAASGDVQGFAQIVGKDGKAITTYGAPTLGVSVPSDPSLNSTTIRQGRLPATDGEVAIDAYTARVHNLRVGDMVKMLFQGPSQTFRLVGTFGFEDVDSMAGATVAAFDLRTAQQVLDKGAAYDSIAVKALPGWSQERLRDSVAKQLGGDWEVITGQTQSDRTYDVIKQGMGFFSTAMLVFAAIALFVGGFIIFNTFSILLAQRTRELGLLRALGASSRQVVVSVVVDALVLGAVASLLGLAVGAGIALLLTQAMNALGMELPPAPLQYQMRTVVVSLAVGIGLTVLSSIGPALRTRRLSPMAALQSGLAGDRAGRLRRRLVLGIPAAVGGLAMLLAAITGRTGQGLVLFAAGTTALFLGVAALSPLIVRPVVQVLGWPLARFFHVPARLGVRNAMRSPSRTARTAAAVTIGLGLVTFATIFGASMKASVGAAIDDNITSDYILSPQSQTGAFSPDVVRLIRPIRGIEAVAELRVGYFERNGALEGVGGADAVAMMQTTKIKVLSGDLKRINDSGVAIGKTVADAGGLRVGQSIDMTFDSVGTKHVPIVAIYDDASGSVGRYLLGLPLFSQNFTQQLDSAVMIKLAPGADRTAVQAEMTRVLQPFPNVKVQDLAGFRSDALAQVDQLVSMVYALLALAVIIALLGIVNTLALSTLERTRELGLLRAVGMTRREVRAMVRHEAVIVAVLGALIGLAVGLVLALVAIAGMRESGLGVTSIPVAQLAIFLVLSALAGIVAAVAPARRAARVDVIEAISSL